MSGDGSGGGGNTPRLGSTLGRYRIESLLGRGGMGVVLLATDTELERPVALKLLAPELAHDPVFRERFLRESRMAAAIEHPGIVPIYEAGTFGDQLFIAMRYVPGRDLATVLRHEAPLDPVRTLALATGLAEALDAAHARGLVHRDVKPANVLLEPGDPERALLTDFGLTHRHGQTAAWSQGGLVGTLEYMAPELIERGPVDARADQYSLACLVFHCLAGSPPFDADSEAGLLYAQVHAPRPLLSERRPGLGGSLDGVFTRGLARDPAARYPDCRSLVVDAWRLMPGATGPGLAAEAPAESVSPARLAEAPAESVSPARLAAAPDPGPAIASPGRRSRSFILGSVVAVALAVPIAGLLAISLARPPVVPTQSTGGSGNPGSVASAPGTTLPDQPPGTQEMVVFADQADGDRNIYRIDPGGGPPVAIRATGREETNPSISPDGHWIAYQVGRAPRRDVWIMNSRGDDARQLTFNDHDDWAPDWSPDGRSLVFNSDRDGGPDLYLLTGGAEGFDERRIVNLTARPADEEYPQFLPDGRIAFSTNYWGGNRDIATIDPDRPRSLRDMRHLTEGDPYELYPTSAPDGRIVFARGPDYLSTRLFARSSSGRIRSLTDDDDLATFPSVSPDGSQIVFSRGGAEAAELYLLPIGGGDPKPLTRNLKHAIQPDWGYLVTSPQRDADPSPTITS